MKPSEYIRRRLHVGFCNDQAAVNNRHLTGVDALLWGTDYPHPEGTWPQSREVLERLFTAVPEDEKRWIVGGTAARLYQFDA